MVTKVVGSRFVVLAALCAVGAASNAQAEYPGALWNPAFSGNFGNRPAGYDISDVVIHIMEGSYLGSISWFQNPASGVSAHYMLKSSNGEITQMVLESKRAFHSGISYYNNNSIGIEHEATSTSTSWYTEAMYQSSAALTRYLTNKYGIIRNRTHILGHRETGANTTCPGPHWNWTKYMGYVTQGATFASTTWPSFIQPGNQLDVTVNFTNSGDFTWLNTAGSADRVELRTQIPANRVSPFFTSGNWISSSKPASVFATTAAGGTGQFRFRLTAPLTTGNYSESFQLYRGTSGGYFGPVITISTGVGQVDSTVDNTDPGYSAIGTWSTGTSSTDKEGSDYRFVNAAIKNASRSEWRLNAPSAGWYNIYAKWPAGTNRSSRVTYEVVGARDIIRKVVDQRSNGGTWILLGRSRLTTAGALVRVLGSSSAAGVIMADAARIVGPLP